MPQVLPVQCYLPKIKKRFSKRKIIKTRLQNITGESQFPVFKKNILRTKHDRSYLNHIEYTFVNMDQSTKSGLSGLNLLVKQNTNSFRL